MRVKTLADHGPLTPAAQRRNSGWLVSICHRLLRIPQAFCEVDGVYTNKAPGGIAYRCSFRVTEAAYLIERVMDAGRRPEDGPVELRPEKLYSRSQVPLPVRLWAGPMTAATTMPP